MTKAIIRTVMVSGAVFLSNAAPALSHHAFSAEFDLTKPIALAGTVTKVDWSNPHIWFHIDVRDERTGKVKTWSLEMGSPNGLSKLGWGRSTMKVGDQVDVKGFLAKDGADKANAVQVILPDGRNLSAGSSAGSR